MEYYSAIKEWNFAIFDNMEGITLSEISQTEKENTLHLYAESEK